MPVGELHRKTRVERTTLVFDTWARVSDQELVATWRNVLLDDAERAMLVLLAERLNYLGRSESWVEGRVMGDAEQTPDANCFPEDRLNTPGRGWEQTVLLAPEGVSAYATWRATRLEETLADLQLPEGRKPATALLAKRARAAEPYPADLLGVPAKGHHMVAFLTVGTGLPAAGESSTGVQPMPFPSARQRQGRPLV